ncbi:MAG: hypothetical protein WCF85_00405 [Rhodospirillaceae bacterium]
MSAETETQAIESPEGELEVVCAKATVARMTALRDRRQDNLYPEQAWNELINAASWAKPESADSPGGLPPEPSLEIPHLKTPGKARRIASFDVSALCQLPTIAPRDDAMVNVAMATATPAVRPQQPKPALVIPEAAPQSDEDRPLPAPPPQSGLEPESGSPSETGSEPAEPSVMFDVWANAEGAWRTDLEPEAAPLPEPEAAPQALPEPLPSPAELTTLTQPVADAVEPESEPVQSAQSTEPVAEPTFEPIIEPAPSVAPETPKPETPKPETPKPAASAPPPTTPQRPSHPRPAGIRQVRTLLFHGGPLSSPYPISVTIIIEPLTHPVGSPPPPAPVAPEVPVSPPPSSQPLAEAPAQPTMPRVEPARTRPVTPAESPGGLFALAGWIGGALGLGGGAAKPTPTTRQKKPAAGPSDSGRVSPHSVQGKSHR